MVFCFLPRFAAITPCRDIKYLVKKGRDDQRRPEGFKEIPLPLPRKQRLTTTRFQAVEYLFKTPEDTSNGCSSKISHFRASCSRRLLISESRSTYDILLTH